MWWASCSVSAKLPWSLWRKDDCLGDTSVLLSPSMSSGFSACAPEFLSDSTVWPLGWGILSWEIIVRIPLSLWSYVIRVKPVSGKHRSSVTSREESRCGSQWEQRRAKLPVLISISGFFCLSFILVRGPVEAASQPRPWLKPLCTDLCDWQTGQEPSPRQTFQIEQAQAQAGYKFPRPAGFFCKSQDSFD